MYWSEATYARLFLQFQSTWQLTKASLPRFKVKNDNTLGAKGQFTWGPKSSVPLMLASPNIEAKSQLLSLKKPLKYDQISWK